MKKFLAITLLLSFTSCHPTIKDDLLHLKQELQSPLDSLSREEKQREVYDYFIKLIESASLIDQKTKDTMVSQFELLFALEHLRSALTDSALTILIAANSKFDNQGEKRASLVRTTNMLQRNLLASRSKTKNHHETIIRFCSLLRHFLPHALAPTWLERVKSYVSPKKALISATLAPLVLAFIYRKELKQAAHDVQKKALEVFGTNESYLEISEDLIKKGIPKKIVDQALPVLMEELQKMMKKKQHLLYGELASLKLDREKIEQELETTIDAEKISKLNQELHATNLKINYREKEFEKANEKFSTQLNEALPLTLTKLYERGLIRSIKDAKTFKGVIWTVTKEKSKGKLASLKNWFFGTEEN